MGSLMKTANQTIIDELTHYRDWLVLAARTLEARGEKQAALHATGAIDSLDRCLTELRGSRERRKVDAA